MNLPWSQPRFVEHEVNGESQKFYEISGFKLIALKDTIRVVIDNMVRLQRNPREDAGSEETREQERTELVEGKMAYVPKSLTVNKKSPIPTDLARYHDEQRNGALTFMMKELLSPNTYRELVLLCVSSLRDLFPDKLDKKEQEEIVESLPLGTFVELLTGMLKANTKVFGPFEGLILTAMERLKDRLDQVGQAPQDED